MNQTNERTAPRVFVTQANMRHSYAELSAYGEAVFLTQSEYSPEPAPPRFNSTIFREIVAKMTQYIPGVDFIVTTGSAIPNVIVGVCLAAKPGQHQILKWSNRSRSYELFKVIT